MNRNFLPALTSVVVFAIAATCCDGAIAHEFDDGFVDRSMSVIVHDRKVHVEYAVGCNPTTMEAWLKGLTEESSTLGEHDSIENGSKKSVAESETVSRSPAQPTTEKKEPEKNDLKAVVNQPGKEPNSETSHRLGNRPQTVDDTSSPSGIEADVPTVGEKTLAQIAKIETDFRTALYSQITEKVLVECNRVPIKLEALSVDISPRHHVNAVVKLTFDLPDGDDFELKLTDQMFRHNEGSVRYALKPRGSIVAANSNVAPILIRAPRTMVKGLTEEKRREVCTIRCQLALVSNSSNAK